MSQPGEVAVETISSNIVPAEDIQGEVQQDPGDIMAEGQPENVLPEPSGSALAGEQQPENQEETNVSATEEPKDETESSYEEETPPVLTEAQVCLQQGYYIVKAGDSLEKVCFKIYGNYDKLEEICRLNGIENQNTIFAGQKITLP